ncbi:MAG: hypothetical protein U0X20_09890 [Caldilineaceae bacterium]
MWRLEQVGECEGERREDTTGTDDDMIAAEQAVGADADRCAPVTSVTVVKGCVTLRPTPVAGGMNLTTPPGPTGSPLLLATCTARSAGRYWRSWSAHRLPDRQAEPLRLVGAHVRRRAHRPRAQPTDVAERRACVRTRADGRTPRQQPQVSPPAASTNRGSPSARPSPGQPPCTRRGCRRQFPVSLSTILLRTSGEPAWLPHITVLVIVTVDHELE